MVLSPLTVNDLPASVRLFVIPGAILLPRAVIPLNVFEPKYLAMVTQAVQSDQQIAVIQPKSPKKGDLYQTGCLGQIVSYSETEDGRFLISLRGISRFHTLDILDEAPGYKSATVDWQDFKLDIRTQSEKLKNRDLFLNTLWPFLKSFEMGCEKTLLWDTGDEDLVNMISMVCPFPPAEKQALLEAKTLTDRADILMCLMKMALCDAQGCCELPC